MSLYQSMSIGQVEAPPLRPGTHPVYPVETPSDVGQSAESAHYKLVVGEFCEGGCCMTSDLSESDKLLILPPGRAMEKSVEENESQMVNGIGRGLCQAEAPAGWRAGRLHTPMDDHILLRVRCQIAIRLRVCRRLAQY